MLKNKEYYEFDNNEIYEVDKNISKEEKSLFVLIKNTMHPNIIVRKNKKLESMLNKNIFNNFHFPYLIFKSIYIKDTSNDLLFCRNFLIDYYIDRENKKIRVKFINFLMNKWLELEKAKTYYDGEKGKIYLNLSYKYKNDNEIVNIIEKSFFDILKEIVINYEIDLYRHENSSLIKIQDFISKGKKVEDEKRIKKYLIERNFK